MLAPTLGWNAGPGPLDQLEQGLLHPFTRHVSGNRRIFGFTGDLVDFVDVHNAPLSLLHIVITALQQLADNVLYVFSDIARFSQRGGIGHNKWNMQHACQRLGQ